MPLKRFNDGSDVILTLDPQTSFKVTTCHQTKGTIWMRYEIGDKGKKICSGQ